MLFFSPSRASARRESAERETHDSRRLSSTSRAHPRDAPARSGQRANRGGFFQPLARVREMRKRGSGNTRFAAAFFSPSRASVRRESAEWATCDSRRILQHFARICETRQRGVGNARFTAAFFNPSCASARRASAEWATRDSRQLSSAPRAHPGGAPARSRQRAIRGGFLQSLARLHETRKRGAGNARFAALFFSPSRASVRRESAERAARDSRRILQHFVRICETRKRETGSA